MKVAGIDVGSLYTKAVILEDSTLLSYSVITTADVADVAAREALDHALQNAGLSTKDTGYIISTGAQRKEVSFVQAHRSTMVCLSKGAHLLFPAGRTVIDVGAENSYAIKLNDRGDVIDFTENDKCAAGAGIFLEAMTKLLAMPLDEMIAAALKAENAAEISSTCTVFAEQEIISHAFSIPPVPLNDIIAGIHASLAVRVAGLARRVRIAPEVVLCGGVAKNAAFAQRLALRLNSDLLIPQEPQIVAALGAALIASDRLQAQKGD